MNKLERAILREIARAVFLMAIRSGMIGVDRRLGLLLDEAGWRQEGT